MGITFLLTPFIVSSLGVEANGFIGLSNNIIGYLQLATVALNSMAGRYITIEYHRGNLQMANRYFSSVFYSNCLLATVIFVISLCLLHYIEYVIEIPDYLVRDVKVLFLLLSISTCISMVFNVYNVGTFIANRLDIGSIRNLISNIIRATILVFAFSLFSPYLWYVGLSALVCGIYLVIANVVLTHKLTPELQFKKELFDFSKVKELLSSGVWNLIGKLGEILQRGLDLLFANWFINAKAMGILSISTQIPFVILSVFGLLSSSFAPTMTRDFAQGNIDSIKKELSKSIRILSIFMLLPLSVLYVYGDVFYHLWVPSEDAHLLQWLTICGTFALIFTSPLESFWNLFTVTNKIKGSSIFMIINSVLVFATVVAGLFIAESIEAKMFIIAGVRSLWGVLRGLLFLPIYAAYCLNEKWNTFYPMMVKPLTGLVLSLALCFCLRWIYIPNDWIGFFSMAFVVAVISLSIGCALILSKHDIGYLYSRIKKRL